MNGGPFDAAGDLTAWVAVVVEQRRRQLDWPSAASVARQAGLNERTVERFFNGRPGSWTTTTALARWAGYDLMPVERKTAP